MRHQPGIQPCCARWRSPSCGTWREVWPQDPRLLQSLSLRAAQQRFPGAQRSLAASPPRREMQRGSGYLGLARKLGFYIPCKLFFPLLWLSMLTGGEGCTLVMKCIPSPQKAARKFPFSHEMFIYFGPSRVCFAVKHPQVGPGAVIFVSSSGASSCEFACVGTLGKLSWLSDRSQSLCFVVASNFSLWWPPLTPPWPLWVSQRCFWGIYPAFTGGGCCVVWL